MHLYITEYQHILHLKKWSKTKLEVWRLKLEENLTLNSYPQGEGLTYRLPDWRNFSREVLVFKRIILNNLWVSNKKSYLCSLNNQVFIDFHHSHALLASNGKSIHRQNRPQNQLICSDKFVVNINSTTVVCVLLLFQTKKNNTTRTLHKALFTNSI